MEKKKALKAKSPKQKQKKEVRTWTIRPQADGSAYVYCGPDFTKAEVREGYMDVVPKKDFDVMKEKYANELVRKIGAEFGRDLANDELKKYKKKELKLASEIRNEGKKKAELPK